MSRMFSTQFSRAALLVCGPGLAVWMEEEVSVHPPGCWCCWGRVDPSRSTKVSDFISVGAVDDSCSADPAWQPEISFSFCCRRGGLDHVHGQKPPRQEVRKRHPERWSFASARVLLLCRSWWHHEETPWDPDLYRSNQGTACCLRKSKKIAWIL